jgi:hypothetical protein
LGGRIRITTILQFYLSGRRRQMMREKSIRLAVPGLLLVGLILAASPAHGASSIIDFESFGDQVALGAVPVVDNVVTFSILDPLTGAVSSAYTAKFGDDGPETAFVPDDVPAGLQSGTFLTDEFDGPSLKGIYQMAFAKPISQLSLDLYDYRRDGGPALGDQAILTVYDAGGVALGSDVFTIPTPNPVDGNIEHLSVDVGSYSIMSADITYSGAGQNNGLDVGTGIDNVAFSTIPAPGAMLLGSLGMGVVGWLRRRRTL